MKTITTNRIIFLTLFTVMLMMFFIDMSFAQTSPFDSVDQKGQELTSWASGTLWTILSTIAILIVAGSVFFGKLNWGVAITIVLAIIIGFNAGNIVELLRS